ncbi:hypothetical protein A3Q56_00071 [Intoshia linei]|uniref:Uncharacterized protein n=1 Tax=Intoshia linei TaxID=1819745 RepID=A0A177BD43_9BILA|nr:hypothetical protein A3Q56_00071 [Intoshia linei]
MNASDIPNMFPLTCALDGLRKTNENALNFKNKIEKCVETTLNSEKFESGIFTNTFTQTNTSQFNSYDPTESIRKAEHVLESAYEQRKDTIKNLNYLNILSTFRNSGKNTKLQGFKKIFNGQICPIDKIVKKKVIS